MNLESSTAAGAAVLVVDDELANVALIESILYRSGMTNVRGTTDPTTVAAMFRQERPDVLLVDLHMPVLSGMELHLRLEEQRRTLDAQEIGRAHV